MANRGPMIPERLLSLFKSMDFLAQARENDKPCFKNACYVQSNAPLGWLMRWWYCEKQSTNGNSYVRACCKEAVEAFEQYEGHDLGKVILEKMLAMRVGIMALVRTYEREIATANDLKLSVLLLDMAIPEAAKVAAGISAPPRRDDAGDKKAATIVAPKPSPASVASPVGTSIVEHARAGSTSPQPAAGPTSPQPVAGSTSSLDQPAEKPEDAKDPKEQKERDPKEGRRGKGR